MQQHTVFNPCPHNRPLPDFFFPLIIAHLRSFSWLFTYYGPLGPKKKKLSVSDFLPTLLNYMLLKSFFRGLRDFRKKSTKTWVFLVILHLIIMFILFRIYFYNSIFILNDTKHTWYGMLCSNFHIYQRLLKDKKNEKIKTFPYLPTLKL